jgi:GT2 family glycosyltransferase
MSTHVRQGPQAGALVSPGASWSAAHDRTVVSAWPSVVIGIATAGRREQVRLTLAQLAGQWLLPQRVVVCPAGADDFDETNVPDMGCPVEVVHGPRGLTAQRNTIIKACADVDLVIFLDDDFYPAPDYVQQVAALFAAHPEIVVATNHPVRDGATGPGIAHADAVALINALRPEPGAAQVRDTYGGYGCNMTVRLQPVREHGVWFDVNLPLYGWLEDIDFSRRMAAHGRVARCSALRGVHLATKRGRSSGLRLGYSQIANPLYLIGKGSMSRRYGWRHMAKNFAKNLLRWVWPEPWVDRRGRLRGNLIALGDWLHRRLDPRRVELLD